MTSTLPSSDYGRFCNQLIRNLAISRVAEKHNLQAVYAHAQKIQKLGINLYSGNNTFDKTIIINDDNYFSINDCEKFESNLDGNASFFQTQKISKMLHTYLHSIQSSIIAKNPFRSRYNNNNDVCVHIRLSDVAKWNPGLYYYLDTIRSIEFDTLYITTDEPSHAYVQEIRKLYPDSIVLTYDEVETLQFASTCRHIILSHGSFSAVIGYLAFFSVVHYSKYEAGKIWYGDMFSIDGWICHTADKTLELE